MKILSLFQRNNSDFWHQVSLKKNEKSSANADAESIVDQIKKLRAGTSIEDEDRMNVLTNLQHLADQLLEMVNSTPGMISRDP